VKAWPAGQDADAIAQQTAVGGVMNVGFHHRGIDAQLAAGSDFTLPYFQVQRAKMILLAAEGLSNNRIAARLDTRREVVCFWRKRFFAERLAGLEERSRPGRPRTFSP
jgi:hypothetical protein